MWRRERNFLSHLCGTVWVCGERAKFVELEAKHAVEDGESRCTGQSLIDTGKSSLMSSFQQPGSALRLRGSGCCPSKAEERSSSSAVSTASIKPKMASREDICVCLFVEDPTNEAVAAYSRMNEIKIRVLLFPGGGGAP